MHIRIPATDRTVTGPELSMTNGALVLRYDIERDESGPTWSTITFDDVVAVDFRDSSAMTSKDVASSDQMHVIEDSSWLSEIVRRRHNIVGSSDDSHGRCYRH